MGIQMDPMGFGGQQVNGGGGDLSARLEDLLCVRCNEGFELNEQIVNSGGQVWHAECFV